MALKVALVYNLYRGKAEEADFDLPLTIDTLTASINKRHCCIPIEGDTNYSQWISALQQLKPDIIFNVAEGYHGAAREAFYPALFEQLNLPYTGPGPIELLISHDKFLTKNLLIPHGIKMPKGIIIKNKEDVNEIEEKIKRLSFPLITKLNVAGSSLGMNKNSINTTVTALRSHTSRIYNKYRSNLLIEEYIEGLDFSMTYIEGLGIFGPIQYIYPNSTIYDFRLKTTQNHTVEVVVPLYINEQLKQELRAVTKKITDIFDINGYCRIDFRINSTDEIFFLEINGQVCFHPQGAFILAAIQQGYSYTDLVHHIINFAYTHTKRTSIIKK